MIHQTKKFSVRRPRGLALLLALCLVLGIFSGCTVSPREELAPSSSQENSAPSSSPPKEKGESSAPPVSSPSSKEESLKESTIESSEPPKEEAPPESSREKPTAPSVPLKDVYPITDEEVHKYLQTPLEDLLPLDNTAIPWGPGITSGEIRPAAPVELQARYQDVGAHFIAPDSPTLYLTFDEGYDAGYNEEILDILWEKDTPAIFFVTLGFVKSRPDLVQRMVAEGHQLGNHSWKHKAFPSMEPMDCAKDVLFLHQYVEENFGYTMTLCRPPEGAFSQRTLALLQALGYESMFWSFAYKDWILDQQPDPSTALETILGRSHPGAIYLLHAVSSTNAQVLPAVIDQLREKGYEFALW